jgi:hypothetical protein
MADRARRTGTPWRCRDPSGGVVDVAPADPDLAAADLFEAGDHPEQGRFAAAGRADEHDELAVLDLQLDVLQDLEVAVGLLDVRIRAMPCD